MQKKILQLIVYLTTSNCNRDQNKRACNLKLEQFFNPLATNEMGAVSTISMNVEVTYFTYYNNSIDH